MILLLMTSALLTAAQPAPAPAAAVPAAPADVDRAANALARLRAADANHDGKWDKAEWLAAGRRERGFAYIDADKDGFVTEEEVRAGMDRMRAMRAARSPD